MTDRREVEPTGEEIDANVEEAFQEVDRLEAEMKRSPELCTAFAKRHFGVENPAPDQLETMFAVMGRFCGENGRLPTLGVEADFNQVVENIGRNAGFLRDLKAKTDRVVNPPELYGPVVRRLAERLSYMRHKIPEAEFLEVVQEAAIQFGMEHDGRAPNPESDLDLEAIAASYLPEELDKKR